MHVEGSMRLRWFSLCSVGECDGIQSKVKVSIISLAESQHILLRHGGTSRCAGYELLETIELVFTMC